MIGSTRQVRVYAYREPADMRKSFNTLAALVVQGLGRDIMSGDIFLFVGRTRKLAMTRSGDVYFSALDSRTAKLGSTLAITKQGAAHPSLVWDGSGLAAAWHDFRYGDEEVLFCRLFR